MKNNKYFGSKLNTMLLIILILLMVFALCFMYKNKDIYISPPLNKNNVETIAKNINTYPIKDLEGNKEDLLAFSIRPYSQVHNIVSYRGTIEGGYFFEGNILINILDANKNILLKSNATAKTNWMTKGPVDFEGNIDFVKLSKGSAYIEIQNDNPSDGEGYKKSILIPIIIN